MTLKRNVPEYTIVVARDAHRAEKYAAEQIQKYLYLATGFCYPRVSDCIPQSGKEIRVGIGARGEDYRIDKFSLGEEGYVIKTVGDNVLIAGFTPRGTLYGAFSFLEKTVGFRAYTKDVETFCKIRKLVMPIFNVVEQPAFEYRDAFFTNAFNREFCVKNKLNTSVADISENMGGSTKFYNIGHSFEALIPSKTYFSSNPEYFALINGERRDSQPCLTHTAVFDIVLKNLKKQIREHRDCKIFSVAQNDVNECCECSYCKAINDREESSAGTNIYFVNKIAEEIEKEFPDVLIHTFAYRFTRKAPKFVKPRHNVIVRLCNIECDWSRPLSELAENGNESAKNFLRDLRDWSEICDHLYIWDYAVNFHHYLLPFPNVFSMVENIRFYAKIGIKGVFEQGNYSLGGGAALDDLKSYVIAKLLWNPDADVNAIIDDFCLHVYGKGGKYIKKYIDLMCDAVKEHTLTLYDKPNAPYLNEVLLRKSKALFAHALAEAETDEIKKRIEKEKLSIDYWEIVATEEKRMRVKATNEFAKKLREFGISEIMEATPLADSLNFMKCSRYTEKKFERYDYLR